MNEPQEIQDFMMQHVQTLRFTEHTKGYAYRTDVVLYAGPYDYYNPPPKLQLTLECTLEALNLDGLVSMSFKEAREYLLSQEAEFQQLMSNDTRYLVSKMSRRVSRISASSSQRKSITLEDY